MQFRLTYQEISDLIERKAGRSIPVMYGGPHTVRISYEVSMFVKTASVGLDLTVDQVDENGNIILSYNAGMGIDFMIKTALNHAKSQPGGDMIDLLPDNRILINLSKNAQAGSLFDHVTLKDICFDEQFAIIEFVPKGF
ncbi:MAG: hypothetical protein J5677_05130 [Bacteroidales bacterium]|nr:hypothetical protein [Bacteroidales bacterium]